MIYSRFTICFTVQAFSSLKTSFQIHLISTSHSSMEIMKPWWKSLPKWLRAVRDSACCSVERMNENEIILKCWKKGVQCSRNKCVHFEPTYVAMLNNNPSTTSVECIIIQMNKMHMQNDFVTYDWGEYMKYKCYYPFNSVKFEIFVLLWVCPTSTADQIL